MEQHKEWILPLDISYVSSTQESHVVESCNLKKPVKPSYQDDGST